MQKIVDITDLSQPVKRPKKGYLFCKRALDILMSLTVMAVLLPLSAVIAVIAAWDTKGSPLFVQQRIGRNLKPFKVLKFRTMKTNAPADKPTYLLDNHDRYISRVGRCIRKLSLDEIPQLLNILKGDMSFVGPRPVVAGETELIRLRNRIGADIVRPGLTGLAQISGRDNVPVRRKAYLDRVYVDSMCMRADARILLKTAVHVLTSRGIKEGANPRIAGTERYKDADHKAI
ncbi:MAG: sugar transferase [Oscillospiraceae bacterium]|nr:sugar transferase [Oscillospiraceae bacterium]